MGSLAAVVLHLTAGVAITASAVGFVRWLEFRASEAEGENACKQNVASQPGTVAHETAAFLKRRHEWGLQGHGYQIYSFILQLIICFIMMKYTAVTAHLRLRDIA